MIRHKIENHFNSYSIQLITNTVQQINVLENIGRTIFVTLFEQSVKIYHRAKQFIDVLKIGNVITQIVSRRRIYRIQPNGVDS